VIPASACRCDISGPFSVVSSQQAPLTTENWRLASATIALYLRAKSPCQHPLVGAFCLARGCSEG
jgi:hypothetical protein